MIDDPRTDAALDEEIARALAVDPSPAFVATIRHRVANTRVSGIWTWSRISSIAAVTVGVAAGVVIAAAIGTRMTSRPRSQPVVTEWIRAWTPGVMDAETPAVALRDVIASGRPRQRVRRTTHAEPECIIDPREARAMKAFLDALIGGRMDVAGLLSGSTPVMDAAPAEDIQIEPIDVRPLSEAVGQPTDRGERQ